MPLYNKIRSLKRQLEVAKRANQSSVLAKKRTKPNKRNKDDSDDQIQPINRPEIPEHHESLGHDESCEQQQLPEPRVQESLATVQEKGTVVSTPEKDAIQLMWKDNILPAKAPNMLKELVALNTLVKHVASAPKRTRKAILTKKVPKSHPRCKSWLARKIGINRHYVLSPAKKKQNQKRKAYLQKKKQVLNFLKRPENSVMLPQKKNALPHGLQRYALNDTVKNLYHKFMLQFPATRMSFSTFAKQRPKYIKTIKWAERLQCLCVKHQNVSLKLRAIKIFQSPNVFIRENTRDEILHILEKLPDQKIKFQVWKMEEISCTEEKVVKKVRLQEDEFSKTEFVDIVDEELAIFREHVRRTTEQYSQIRKLREILDIDSEVTVQMDYSENYGCIYQEEPSQVFYDRQLITVHPMVVHYKSADGTLQHQSYVGVTDITKHSVGTTLSFIYKLIPHIQELKPAVKTVHYITDSPASQYRNKFILKLVADHAKLFDGISATWEYLEAGHGKGPCDGIGGSIKKLAEIAVKKGQIIKCAADFLTWYNTEPASMKMFLVTPADVKHAESKVKNAAYVKGISSVHSIRPFGSKIYFRETSCFDECCRYEVSGHEWQETSVKVCTSDTGFQSSEITPDQDSVQDVSVMKYNISDFVHVIFRRKQYVGQIVRIDLEDREYYINFMTRRKSGKYVFPKIKEEMWIRQTEIVGIFDDK